MEGVSGVCTRSQCLRAAQGVPTSVDDGPETCPICLDVLDDATANALSCGHCFHPGCIIFALRRDSRCPVCRDDPANDDASEVSSVDNEPTIEDALAIAESRCDTSPGVRRQFATITKWQKKLKDSRRIIRHLRTALAPLDRAVELQVDSYALALWKLHKDKNKELIHNIEYATIDQRKAIKHIRATKIRIARAHGYNDTHDSDDSDDDGYLDDRL